MESGSSKSIKEQIYNYFGFEMGNNISCYDDLFNSIKLGAKFSEICKYLELDADKLSKYVKKYALHMIYEEVIDISLEKKILLENYSYLWFSEDNNDDSDIVEDMSTEYFPDIDYFFEYYSFEYLSDLLNVQFDESDDNKLRLMEELRVREELRKEIFPQISLDGNNKRNDNKSISTDIDQLWHSSSKISGSLYRNIFSWKLKDDDMTLTRQPSFIINENQDKDDSKKFVQNAIEKTDLFLKSLKKQAKNHSITQELLMFERHTNMLFLLDSATVMAVKQYNRNEMKVLSSFILIDDIDIRKCFSSVFFSGNGLSVKFIYGKGYYHFFLLNFMLIPFLIKFIKKKIILFIPPLRTTDINPDIRGKVIELYKREYVYRLVRNPMHKGPIQELKKIDIITNRVNFEDYVGEFFELYSIVRGLKSVLNGKKRSKRHFHANVVTEPILWYRNNKKEQKENENKKGETVSNKDDMDKVAEIIDSLVNDISFVIINYGLKLKYNQSKKKVTSLNKVVKTFHSYFENLEEAKAKEEYKKFIKEISRLGYKF